MGAVIRVPLEFIGLGGIIADRSAEYEQETAAYHNPEQETSDVQEEVQADWHGKSSQARVRYKSSEERVNIEVGDFISDAGTDVRAADEMRKPDRKTDAECLACYNNQHSAMSSCLFGVKYTCSQAKERIDNDHGKPDDAGHAQIRLAVDQAI